MTDQEINKTIAELIGCDYTDDWHHKDGVINFCEDLNAMYQAENHLGDPQIHDEYEEALGNVMGNVGWLSHASAKERAEAFLRVFNKWK